MMKLEQQVCSLELAKRLKELGVKQESYFEWSCDMDHLTSMPCEKLEHFRVWKREDLSDGYSAFTVAELGELLPPTIGDQTWFSYTKSHNGWKGVCQKIGYQRWDKLEGQSFLEILFKEKVETVPQHHHDDDETEADLRAKMLIHLIEKEIVKP